ncbi:MAG: hypothetical protein M1819_007265 [Sarea resinae]|nr:MAG: hypothetical protein M1819_007265 [Sarea resinae]
MHLLDSARLLPRSASCTIAVEDSFGPQEKYCLGGFDFTLLFEETFLSIAPNGLFLIAALLRSFVLFKERTKVNREVLYWLKLVNFAALNQCASIDRSAGETVDPEDTDVHGFRSSKLLGRSQPLISLRTRTYAFDSPVNHHRLIPFFLDCIGHSKNENVMEDTRRRGDSGAVYRDSRAAKKRRILRVEFSDSPSEVTSSVYNRILFWWLNPLLLEGSRKDLALNDLFSLDEALSSSNAVDTGLILRWSRLSNKKKSHSLLGLAVKEYKWILISGVLPRMCQIGFTFAQPFLTGATVRLIGSPVDSNSKNKGYGLIAAYAIVYIGIAITTAQAQHKAYRTITMLRGALVSMIYQKTMHLSIGALEDSAPITLMSADIERIGTGLRYMHDTWASVIEIALALWLLWRQLEIASIAPIIVSFGCTAIAVYIAGLAGNRQKIWIEAIQKRVSMTATMLGSMKGVKMSGLSERLENVIQNLRLREIKASQKFRELLIAVVGLSHLSTSISPVIAFTIYSALSVKNGTDSLGTVKAFTSLTLFTLLATPVGTVVEASTGMMTAIGSIERIRKFLAAAGKDDNRTLTMFTPGGFSPERADPPEPVNHDRSWLRVSVDSDDLNSSEKVCIRTHDADISWDNKDRPILGGLSLTVERHRLTMIIGPVGSGKSTLLRAFLGEIPSIRGSIEIDFSEAAYCGQTPWLTNDTVRQNILGESYYDLQWYRAVVHACALEPDLLQFPQGDETLVGSKGSTLSGGQKQRISLARALYSRQDLVLLDDVLSGLDPITEDHIFAELFGEEGLFRKSETTVILATNAVHRLSFADHIIALGSDGRIVEQGNFAKLGSADGYVQSLAIRNQIAERSRVQREDQTEKGPAIPVDREVAATGDRRVGDFTVYKYYIQTIGYMNWTVFYALMAVFTFLFSFPTVWVMWWSKANDRVPNQHVTKYLGIYWFLGVLAVIFLMLSCWQVTPSHSNSGRLTVVRFLMTSMVSRTARRFHATLLRTVLSAPMSFFSETDLGKTTNRFSQDLELVDMELPLAVLNTSLALLISLSQLIIISVSARYIAAIIPASGIVFFFVQKFYLRTSRQLRLMDIEAKSPLFSHFLETLSGLATIRSYGWEKEYMARNDELLNASQRPYYLLWCVQRWLNLVLDLSVAGFAVVLVGIAVATQGKIGAGFIGMALVNVVSFNESLKALITNWTLLETSMGAVSRIKTFSSTPSENLPAETYRPPPEWPSSGAIEFRDVSARYKPTAELALKMFSAKIGPGQKVGICGRSGSGKSSLVSTLFRLVELETGSIIVDDVDISTVPRQEVREKLIGLPQEPYLFEGSVRENIDPDSLYPDEAITGALERVQLWATLVSKGGLDAPISEDLVSHGQRQLLCLAKSLLRRQSKILVLDEATSNVDALTDGLMQRIIREDFAAHTVIAIAHRLDTILDFDIVLVMEHGALVEIGNPLDLLARQNSIFKTLYASSSGGQDWDSSLEKVRLEEEARVKRAAKRRATRGARRYHRDDDHDDDDHDGDGDGTDDETDCIGADSARRSSRSRSTTARKRLSRAFSSRTAQTEQSEKAGSRKRISRPGSQRSEDSNSVGGMAERSGSREDQETWQSILEYWSVANQIFA